MSTLPVFSSCSLAWNIIKAMRRLSSVEQKLDWPTGFIFVPLYHLLSYYTSTFESKKGQERPQKAINRE